VAELHPVYCRHGDKPRWICDAPAGSEVFADFCRDSRKSRRPHTPDEKD
jgi:hypothetical protein